MLICFILFLSQRGKNSKGHIYGIGSVQYREINPSEKASASVSRNLDMEMRMDNLEANNKTSKEDMVVLKAGLN